MGGLLPWLLLISSRSLLNGVGWSCVSACAKNLVGGAENALGGTLGEWPGLAPRLDITTAILGAWQSKGFAAQQETASASISRISRGVRSVSERSPSSMWPRA